MKYKLYKGALVYDGAPHEETKLTKTQCVSLLKKFSAYFIRNVYDFDCDEQTSFGYVIKDSYEDVDAFSSKMRNQLKKALSIFLVRKIDKDEMIRFGYRVYKSAIESYNPPVNGVGKEKFENSVIKALPEVDYWGVFETSTQEMVAYGIVRRMNVCSNYESFKAIPAYRKQYCLYVMLMEMNKYYLDTLRLKYVSDGARSITNHSNIQPFLMEKFHFRKAYCHVQVYYVWWLKLLVTILFPFRSFFPAGRVKALLFQEEVRRNKLPW